MADIYSANLPAVQGDFFYYAWQCIMAQLESGWLLKHSGNATTKATDSATLNPADPMNCAWTTPAIIQNFSSTGTASITTQSGKDYLITGLSGLVTPTRSNRGGSEGNLLVITNASSAGNNVTWMITRVNSTTSCLARPLVPSTVTASGTSPPVMSITGHLARTRLFNLRVITTVSGALGTAQIRISLDGGSNYATAVVVPSTGIVEVIDNNSVATGIYLRFAGSISNTNNVWTATTAVANDANNGSIRWVERSWLTSTYSSMANGAWISLEGPCTLKIPFGTAPVGNFLRGEVVTQTNTGAKGEILGVTFEPSTGAGYLVIFPRLQGTGNFQEGWSQSDIITGDSSGATVTASAGIIRLVREMVWWRGSDLKSGTLYYQPVQDSLEASSRFGFLSLQSGCTATVCPGGGGTNNAFPTIAYTICGTGGSASHHSQAWIATNYTLASYAGRMQLFNANCIDNQNQSADGSFVSVIGQPSTNAQSTGGLPAFMRLINGEEGDIEPYAAYVPAASGVFTRTRNANTSALASGEMWSGGLINNSQSTTPASFAVNNGYGGWFSWRARSMPSGDAFAANVFASFPGFLYYGAGNNSGAYGIDIPFLYGSNATIPDRAGSTGQTYRPFVLNPIELNLCTSFARGRKGALKWIYTNALGTIAFDTFDNRRWMQCNSVTAGSISGLAFMIPYDGSSTPLQY